MIMYCFCFKSSFYSKVGPTVQRIECVVKQVEKKFVLERGLLSNQPKIISQATSPYDL